jgi:predicted  nucleic acid-binding Zn-ribbon protein
MPAVSELYAIQEVDLALDRIHRRLEEIEEALQETEELKLARQERDEKEEVVQALRARQKELEWEVEEVRSKAGAVEAKLYGGTVRNPKELSDLDADLRALKLQTGRREDVLLSLLVEIDEAEGFSRSAGEAYLRLSNEFETQSGKLGAEKGELEPQAADLKEKRDHMAAAVDRSALRLYELLRERKGGTGLARVEQGMCQGCRISLPATDLKRARAGTGIVQCVSCERILLVT